MGLLKELYRELRTLLTRIFPKSFSEPFIQQSSIERIEVKNPQAPFSLAHTNSMPVNEISNRAVLIRPSPKKSVGK